ncbi:MAG: DUF438 domain-containing protein [candidate division KSB1 bacterium]|nr:DUF438 domain-containing protein [candidate division KSB1 bacterium]
MHLSGATRVGELLKQYPFLLDFLSARWEKFTLLRNPLLRRTVGQVATLAQAAALGGIELDLLLGELASEIRRVTGEEVVVESSAATPVVVSEAGERLEMLKAIIRDLHEDRDVETARQRFQALIKDVDASEIAAMEQRLIEEGMPAEEVRRLCDVHVAVFKEALERHELPGVPPGHPVHTFMQENRAMEELLERMRGLTGGGEVAKSLPTLRSLLDELAKVDLHYLRKENQLFPLLEKHGVSGPSQVMWAIHDDIRAALKSAAQRLGAGQTQEGVATLERALQEISDMIYKEEHVLFPLALEMLTPEEWARVKAGEEEIGFAWITPPPPWTPRAAEPAVAESPPAQSFSLDTGNLTPEQVNLILTHLPLDISFVNEHDEVVYYSAGKERIFPRSPGVIGRKVQKCHPPKSVHIVQQILDEFRSGKKDMAEFWITMNGKFIHIRYFAIRDTAGVYRGCLEVTQDVTQIRALQGEKRLLDW